MARIFANFLRASALGIALCCAGRLAAQTVGPTNGTLLVVGGGAKETAAAQLLIELAGGPAAPIVIVPTAQDRPTYDMTWSGLQPFRDAGATNLILLHTRDRKVADTEEFVKPLRTAKAVWFGGGRQWRLVEAYLHTRAHAEFFGVLNRGGVIGGSSAGASIQASFLVRGDPKGNTIMEGKYQEGFGFLRDVAVDQHLFKRGREGDLVGVIKHHPTLLGIGLDEGAIIKVQGDRCEVVGEKNVAFYEAGLPGKEPYRLLHPKQAFDLKKRALLTGTSPKDEK